MFESIDRQLAAPRRLGPIDNPFPITPMRRPTRFLSSFVCRVALNRTKSQ
jgi:hypothetical protein